MKEIRLAALLVDMEVIAEGLAHAADPRSRTALFQAMRNRLQEADAIICADDDLLYRRIRSHRTA